MRPPEKAFIFGKIVREDLSTKRFKDLLSRTTRVNYLGTLEGRRRQSSNHPPPELLRRFWNPQVQELLKKMFNGKEPSRGINPDEAVAYGAAIQGDIVGGGTIGKMVVLDVVALSQVSQTPLFEKQLYILLLMLARSSRQLDSPRELVV